MNPKASADPGNRDQLPDIFGMFLLQFGKFIDDDQQMSDLFKTVFPIIAVKIIIQVVDRQSTGLGKSSKQDLPPRADLS